MENVKAYLYDASGCDEELSFDEIDTEHLAKNQLLWVNVLERDEQLLNEVTSKLQVKNVPCKTVLDDSGRPDVGRFETFFRFCVASIVTEKDVSPKRLMVDYIVGKNFVVTVHEGEVDHFDEFRKREKGETQFGELDAESFVATLLDLNLVSYFQAIDELERRVDETDERILKKDIETEEFLKDMVGLRRDVAKLRRWLTPHREVFYALSRADFQQIAESDSAEQYRTLNQHFESAVDAVENSRESVLGVFELYATKSAQMTNTFVQRLTFITVLTGSLAVIAGLLGMNFKADIFDLEYGFWGTVIVVAALAVLFTVLARFKRWI
ncbi:MAG: CorA family divalent cation transporter [Pyrinomonadaceae bacterium]